MKRPSVNPVDQADAYFAKLERTAKSTQTRPTGDIVVPSDSTLISEDADGSQAIIGGNGITYINDTIPPKVAGITAVSDVKTVTVMWSGALADSNESIPTDWSHLEVWADGVRKGLILGSTGSSVAFESAPGNTHSITVYSVDLAGNRSDPSDPVFITVEAVTGEVDLQPMIDRQNALEGRIADAESDIDFGDINVNRLTVTDSLFLKEGVAELFSTRILEVGFNTTNAGYSGWTLDATNGFQGFDGAGTKMFEVDMNGNMNSIGGTITGGLFQTSPLANSGIKLSTATGFTMYNPNTNQPSVQLNPDGQSFIDGGLLVSDSITADKISLSDKGAPYLKGSKGETYPFYYNDWGGFYNNATLKSGVTYPAGTVGEWELRMGSPSTNSSSASVPKMLVSAGNKYKLSMFWRSDWTTQSTRVMVRYYDKDKKPMYSLNSAGNGYVGAYQELVYLNGAMPNGTQYLSSSPFTVPAGAMYAELFFTIQNGTATTIDNIFLTDIKIISDVHTVLTPTGLTSYVSGKETMRLNGEDNLLVGRYRTAPLGEPQILIQPTAGSYNGTQLAVWFTPDGTAPGAVTAGLWMEDIPTINTAYPLSLRGQGYAGVQIFGATKIIPTVAGAPALLTTNGQDMQISAGGGNTTVGGALLKLNGRLDPSATTIKSGRVATAALVANAVRDNIQITFPEPFPAGANVCITATVVTTASVAVIINTRNIAVTGFTALIRNMSGIDTGGMSIHYTATQY